MTTPEFRARLRALILDAADSAAEPVAFVDELLAEAIAANVVAGDRISTAAMLRKFADQMMEPA